MITDEQKFKFRNHQTYLYISMRSGCGRKSRPNKAYIHTQLQYCYKDKALESLQSTVRKSILSTTCPNDYIMSSQQMKSDDYYLPLGERSAIPEWSGKQRLNTSNFAYLVHATTPARFIRDVRAQFHIRMRSPRFACANAAGGVQGKEAWTTEKSDMRRVYFTPRSLKPVLQEVFNA